MGQSKFAPPPELETPDVDLPHVSEPELSDATPLQILEDLALRGKSETARVAALKVLVDRKDQLEREKAERAQQEPGECPECAKRANDYVMSDEKAARVLAELHNLGALTWYVLDILDAGIETETGRSRVADFLRAEVLDGKTIEEHVEEKVQDRLRGRSRPC